jgi:hypothetical protein
MDAHLAGESSIAQLVTDVPSQAVALAGCASDGIDLQRRQLALRKIHAARCELTSARNIFIAVHFNPHMRRALPRGFHE